MYLSIHSFIYFGLWRNECLLITGACCFEPLKVMVRGTGVMGVAPGGKGMYFSALSGCIQHKKGFVLFCFVFYFYDFL